MNIYIVSRKNKSAPYDAYVAFVVVAKDGIRARKLTVKKTGFGWVDFEDTKARLIGTSIRKTEGIIFSDFQSG